MMLGASDRERGGVEVEGGESAWRGCLEAGAWVGFGTVVGRLYRQVGGGTGGAG